MRNVMVATDFSERSDRALRRAMILARGADAGLVLVHVVDDDQPKRIVDTERGAAELMLREQVATFREMDGLPCEWRVVLADPFVGIVEAAREIGPDIVVIGPHRRHALMDVFVGTTAERTIRSVAAPVLMANAPPVGPYRHAMITTDLSEASAHAMARFEALGLAAAGQDMRASVLHVFDAPALGLVSTREMPRDQREAYLDEARRDAGAALGRFLNEHGMQASERILRTDETSTANGILSAAGEARADLVVLGTRGRSGLAKLLLGSVAEEVLRRADRDVLAIPPRREAAG